jgi:uncharacterized membrane protein
MSDSPVVSETGRVEAFSDGVLAIAITLLVLELRVPEGREGTFGRALLELWPSYAAYGISFLVIGVMWVNHHSMFVTIGQVDRPLMFLNLILLLMIALVPFPTAVVAATIDGTPADARAGALLYSIVSLGIAFGFSAVRMWTLAHPHLLVADFDVVAARTARGHWSFYLGIIMYIALIGVALISPEICMLGHLLVAIYYVSDRLPRNIKVGRAS